MAIRAETQVDLNRIDDGSPGAQGTTFTPSVNADGDISWTNDGGLPNPTTRNIKGPQGPEGPQGPTGPAGPGVTYITLQNGDDLNDCITKGNVYVTSSTAVCTSLLNAPTGKPDGELQLEVQWLGSDNYLVQRLTCKNGATRKVYLRTYSSGTFGDWTEEGVPYGTSSTAAGTAAKTATISNWDRGSNQYVAIKFTNENTASSPTLNINSTGAAQIMTNGSNSAYWEAGSVVNFYWDGTYYQVANTPVYASTVTVGNPNGDNVYIGNSAVQVKNGSTVNAEFGSDVTLGQSSGRQLKLKSTYGLQLFDAGTQVAGMWYEDQYGQRVFGRGCLTDSYDYATAECRSNCGNLDGKYIVTAGWGNVSDKGDTTLNLRKNEFIASIDQGSTNKTMLQMDDTKLVFGTTSVPKVTTEVSSGNITTTGDLYLKGHSSEVGAHSSKTTSGSVSLSTAGTSYQILSQQLSTGVWVVTGEVEFSSNTNSYRGINIKTTSKSTDWDVRVRASNSGVTRLQTVQIMAFNSDTTVYLNAVSGQASLTATGELEWVRIR